MLLFKCFTDSDIFSGLIPGVISTLIIVAGYVIQYRQFRRQLSEQQAASKEALENQKATAERDLANQKNILIQQLTFAAKSSIVELAVQKAKDCNKLWDDVDDVARSKLISQMVISSEVVDQSIRIFTVECPELMKSRDEFGYVFWKSLDTRVRQFFCFDAFRIAVSLGKKTTYSDQIFSVFIWLKSSMEQLKDMNASHIETLEKWSLEKEYK